LVAWFPPFTNWHLHFADDKAYNKILASYILFQIRVTPLHILPFDVLWAIQ